MDEKLFIDILTLCVTPDVDECDMGTDGCAQNCSNTNGSFVCSCGVGYVLADDDLDCRGNVSLFK